MGFGFGDIASFAAGGPIGYGAYKAITGGGGSTTVNQEPLLTPEQKLAQGHLSNFYQTGRLGNYTAGTPYTGSFGDFNMTDLEKLSGTKLGDMLRSGAPSFLQNAGRVTNDLLTTDKYDPLNKDGVYSGYRAVADRNIADATAATKRNAAFAGNLYSTDTIRGLGDVQAKGTEALNSKLADLYSSYLGNKFSAIPMAESLATTGQNLDMSKLGAGFQYGGLERNLNTAADTAKYNDFLRTRQEQGQQVSAATSLGGASSSPWGTPSVTVPGQNPWMNVLNLLANFGGKAVGAAVGGA